MLLSPPRLGVHQTGGIPQILRQQQRPSVTLHLGPVLSTLRATPPRRQSPGLPHQPQKSAILGTMAITPADSQSVATATSAPYAMGLIVPPRVPVTWPATVPTPTRPHAGMPTDQSSSLAPSVISSNLVPFGFFQFTACFFTPALFRAFFICLSLSSLPLAIKPHFSPTVPPTLSLLLSPAAVSPINLSVLASELHHHSSTSISFLVLSEASQLVSSPLASLVSRPQQQT